MEKAMLRAPPFKALSAIAHLHRVATRQPSIVPHIHMVSVVRHKRPAPASLCARSPYARKAGVTPAPDITARG
jgi:hypothetical protein